MDWLKIVLEMIEKHWDALIEKIESLVAPLFWRPILGPDGRKIGDLVALMLFGLMFAGASLAVVGIVMLSRDLLGNRFGSLLGECGGACATWYLFWRCFRQRFVAPLALKIGRASSYLTGLFLDRVIAPPLWPPSRYLVMACLLALAFLPAKANK
jgi:hypothetical protein